MKTLYLECNMGAAGDMLSASLLDLFDDDEQRSIIEKLNEIAPEGVSVWSEPVTKCGITGTQMHVEINGQEESSQDHHDDKSHHHHTSMAQVEEIINGMDIPVEVKYDAACVYKQLAEAESRAHNKPVSEIHFHEVGMLDAIMDVVNFCYILHKIMPDQIFASPVRTGFGEVMCAHGILPVPAPATACLLQGVPTYAGGIEGEMCTPTGAALLRSHVQKYEERPLMTIEKTGYGIGHKDFAAANCVRAFLGETDESINSNSTAPIDGKYTDHVVELKCNLDDMTGEQIGFATQMLFKAGALDVFTTAIGMKKNRPGILLTVLCRPDDTGKIVPLIFKHTTTIGIRETLCNRYILKRTVVTDKNGIRKKISEGYGVHKEKSEFDDLARLAAKNDTSIF
ncbi:MAG: nickel pincer cofactor biosynthesis protein LarC [Lachnospiraceae bacterium]|nr:MAG: nickel pincer cofactor biosynthesis protein LarC [Lachnospiraceae bacterium]